MAAYIINDSSILSDDDDQDDFRLPVVTPAPPRVRKKLFSHLCTPSLSVDSPSYASEERERLAVYLRVKPKSRHEHEMTMTLCSENTGASEGDMVQIDSENQITFTAPPDSNSFRNGGAEKAKMTHTYTFNRIFPPHANQCDIFETMVLPRVQKFLDGENQMFFAYGSTGSGKTFTIQGTWDQPGLLPRAFDVIFNSIGARQMAGLELKPNCFNRVVQMSKRDIQKLEEDKLSVFSLGLELQKQSEQSKGSKLSDVSKMSGISAFSEDSLSSCDLTNLNSEAIAAMFPHLSKRARDQSSVEIADPDIQFAIWVSFAEIYNECIYDLLESVPTPRHPGERVRREPLKLSEDNNGSIYVKGLKEIKVNSADEAFQVLAIGKANLHCASTRLNHQSSRSHCIFTLKAIRVADISIPHLARVSTLSLCDLAGSERIKKTLNTGERQKEAGNINTSLLVLGRCIKAIRDNQLIKDPKKKQVVPYRESKLTRMFQSFLVGHGKAAMVVNVSQAPYLFDESMQVLKFAALASRVVLRPLPPSTAASQARRTRFSILVEAASKAPSRRSFEWEENKSASHPWDTTTALPELQEEEDFGVEKTYDAQYDALLKVIDDLKERLAKEKQEKAKIETEIRAELCGEFSVILKDVFQHEEESLKEFLNWKHTKFEEKQQCNEPSKGNETIAFQQDELNVMLEERETELKCLNDKMAAMAEAHNFLFEENSKQKESLNAFAQEKEKLSSEVESLKRRLAESDEKLREVRAALVSAESSSSADPILASLRSQLEEKEKLIGELEQGKSNLKGLLDEAGEEYLNKETEVERLTAQLKDIKRKLQSKMLKMSDLSQQLEESQLLATESTKREDELESQVAVLEEMAEKERLQREALEVALSREAEKLKSLAVSKEEVDSIKAKTVQLESELTEEKQRCSALRREKTDLEEEKAKLATSLEATTTEMNARLNQICELRKQLNQKDKELTIVCSKDDRVERELNDEIERLRNSKKRLRQNVESLTKDTNAKDGEIASLEKEVKRFIQTEQKLREDLSSSEAKLTALEQQLGEGEKTWKTEREKQSTVVEKLQVEVTSLKREEVAYKALENQLNSKAKENEVLQSQVRDLTYDLERSKKSRDDVMASYEQKMRKLMEKQTCDQHEIGALRKSMMSKSTPNAELKTLRSEIKTLRDELKQKTGVITNLEKLIRRQNGSSHKSQSEDDKEGVVAAEILALNAVHAAEMEKEREKWKSTVDGYRAANVELQRNIENGAKSGAARKGGLDTPIRESVGGDDSDASDARSTRKRVARSKPVARESNRQAAGSFEGSIVTPRSTRKRTTTCSSSTTSSSVVTSLSVADMACQASFNDSSLLDEADSSGVDVRSSHDGNSEAMAMPARKLARRDASSASSASSASRVLTEANNTNQTPYSSARKRLQRRAQLSSESNDKQAENSPELLPRSAKRKNY